MQCNFGKKGGGTDHSQSRTVTIPSSQQERHTKRSALHFRPSIRVLADLDCEQTEVLKVGQANLTMLPSFSSSSPKERATSHKACVHDSTGIGSS